MNKENEMQEIPFEPGWRISQGNANGGCFGCQERAASEDDLENTAIKVAGYNATQLGSCYHRYDYLGENDNAIFWATYFASKGDGGTKTVKVEVSRNQLPPFSHKVARLMQQDSSGHLLYKVDRLARQKLPLNQFEILVEKEAQALNAAMHDR